MPSRDDERYVEILLNPLKECKKYKPAFGSNESGGVTLTSFRTLYARDPLYHWVGLDDDLMYAAHKAAGGMTSIYRQLGIGCERLLRQIIKDSLGLTAEQVSWSYKYDKGDGKTAVHTLDARITTSDITNLERKEALTSWLARTSTSLGLIEQDLRGVVLEIRQGYKSADSKRQNADLRFGLRAYTEAAHLPVIMIVSTQASSAVCMRYRAANILVLTGCLNELNSTFAFFNDVVGYDLAAFFQRNTELLRNSFREILQALLSPNGAA